MRALAIAVTVAGATSCGRVGFDAGAVRDGADSQGPDTPHVPITFVDAAATQNAIATTIATTPSSLVEPGDLIVVGVSYDGPLRAATVMDSTGDTFAVGSSPTSGGPLVSTMFYALAATSSSETITATIASPGNSYFQLQVWVYRGIAQSAPLDDSAQGQGTSTAVDGVATRALAATTSNELVFEWAECLSTCVAGTGFTPRTSFGGDGAGDRIETAPGSYPATMTLNAAGTNWTIVGATFRGQ